MSMTAEHATQTTAGPELDERTVRRWVPWAVASLALALTCGVLGAAWGTQRPTVHTESADCFSARITTCTLGDGEAVGVSTDVPWTDARGTLHDSGRPACLTPRDTSRSSTVTVHWVETTVDDVTRRTVVQVAC